MLKVQMQNTHNQETTEILFLWLFLPKIYAFGFIFKTSIFQYFNWKKISIENHISANISFTTTNKWLFSLGQMHIIYMI